jgi:MFS transporter, DHA1 family, inner membrane transport protein
VQKEPLPEGLVVATLSKTVASSALRTPYPFISTIAKGLGTSVGHLGSILGLAELLGLFTAGIGRSLDRGFHRRWFTIGIGGVTLGSTVIAATRNLLGFGIGFGLICLGIAIFSTTGHAWIGSTVNYSVRGRAIGLFETSWAASLLIAAPVFGLLIALTTWWMPFVVLAVLSAISVWLLYRSVPARTITTTVAENDGLKAHAKLRLTKRIFLTLLSSFLITFSAIFVFAIYGAWWEDSFGLSTRVIGILSVTIGIAELIASGSTVRITDRWGKRTSVLRGSALMLLGIAFVALRPTMTFAGVAAVVVVFLGFEFAFVSLLSVLSEVGGEQRGAVVGIDHALTTVSRASAAALSTTLYESQGVRLNGLIAMGCLAVSMAAIYFADR